MNVVESAILLALEAHKGQRYGDSPYSKHLSDVAKVLLQFGILTETVCAAAWLHDTLEDTDLTREQIEASCGARVAEIVWRVTDEPGVSRKERKVKTLPKIAADPEAIIVKLADRIANVAESQSNNPGLLAMYRREYPGFAAALREKSPVAAKPMWAWLDAALNRGIAPAAPN